jgi:hypothetical protein
VFIAPPAAPSSRPVKRRMSIRSHGLHPSRGPDGKPLFMDCAALGPRLATRGVLVIAGDVPGSAIMIDLLKQNPILPEDTRLVLVHALDPAAFAGVEADPAWPSAMLAVVATEDLSRVRNLDILPLNQLESGPIRALSLARPEIVMTCHGPPPTTLDEAQALIAGIFGR